MDQQQECRRIVVGVHGSAASLAALRWAAREASLRGTRLQVVHAWEDDAKRLAPYAPDHRKLGKTMGRATTQARVRQAVRNTLGPSPPITVTVAAAEDRPARALANYAAGAELLVLGAPAATTAGIGPVTRACLQHSPCPVVVIHAGGHPPPPAPHTEDARLQPTVAVSPAT